MATVVGFSAKQRQWFLRRDGGRCRFMLRIDGRWVQCRNLAEQIHHVIPRGHAILHMPESFPVNGSKNGISLCAAHHVGYLAGGDYRFVVHPDTEEARLAYQRGNRNAYTEMMEARRKLNEQGLPYWNTDFDWMFTRIVQKSTFLYLVRHPLDPYPADGVRGKTGRRSEDGTYALAAEMFGEAAETKGG